MPSRIKRIFPSGVSFLLCLASLLFGLDALRQRSGAGFWMYDELLPAAVGICTWITGAWFLNGVLQHFVLAPGVIRKGSTPMPRLMVQIIFLLVYAASLVGIVGSVFHKSVTGLITASGAIGIVVGFGLRPLLSDAFTGIALNLERPFVDGDFITVQRGAGSYTGRVVEINWRATRLHSTDGALIVIPNGEMGVSIITNRSRPRAESAFEVSFAFDASVSTDRVLRILNASLLSALSEPGILAAPAPEARLSKVEMAVAFYSLRFWVDPLRCSPANARHSVTKQVLDHLNRAGLSLAMSKQDLFIASQPVRELDSKNEQHRSELLSRVELFKGLDAEELLRLGQGTTVKVVHAGGTVVRQGEPGSSLFVLVEGLLDVIVTAEGKQEPVKVGQMGPGAFFGEMSLLTGEQRSATVTAVCETVIYEVTKDQIGALLTARPALAVALCEAAAARRLRQSNRFAELAQDENESEQKVLGNQLLEKMKSFFNRIFQ
jgi:small-conductance mechanosensitive channel/CRP-like cAMP-binding protein